MARDNRMQDYYLNLHEMQPPAPHYHLYEMTQSNASAPSTYELTAGACGIAGGGGGPLLAVATTLPLPLPPPPLAVLHHDPRKRKPSHYSSDGYEMADCDGLHAPSTSMQPAKRKPSSYSDYDMSGCDTQSMMTSTSMLSPTSATSKRKASSYGASSTYDDDGTDEGRSTRTLPDKKQNHSEIEKRRRDKMNTYITELSTMVPMCGAMSRKLDKLTVLRMAVQHLRSVRGSMTAGPLAARPRPSFLGERELNTLVLQAAQDCFLLVVGCDRGRLLFVSASVSRMLHYDQSELLGQSLFDILHPKDVAKVKEQLSSSELCPRERLIDAKTMLPVKTDVVAGASRLCPGARRSFFCRIKSRAPPADPADPEAKARKMQTDKKYCVVQFTGYLKAWAPAEFCDGAAESSDDDPCNLSCLVAVGRALADMAPPSPPSPPPARPLEYVSRLATDGKFLFVDQRVTLALGYLPQELLGTSMYEYVSPSSLGGVARAHRAALLRREPSPAQPYEFRRKDGTYAHLCSLFKPFRNPWTKDVESLVAKNTVVAHLDAADQLEEPTFDMFKHKADSEMQHLIDSQVESHKIGGAIADEVLRSAAEYSPELPADILHDAVFNQQCTSSPNVMYEQVAMADGLLGQDAQYQEVRNNVPLSSAGAAVTPPGAMLPPSPPPMPPLGLDGNGEAAMAVIMSLLEADAGLGGPVNFSGLPWPLP